MTHITMTHIFGVGKETAFEALVGSTPSGIYWLGEIIPVGTMRII